MADVIDIQQLIDDAVTQRSQVRSGGRDSGYFHVSDAGTCYRKRYLKRLGVPPTVEIATGALRKMLAGDAGHEMLQATLHHHGQLFAAEGTITTHHIQGHFDAIVKPERFTTEKVLLEFKTIEKWGMTHIKKDGPKLEHKLQMFTYWHWLRPDYTDLNQATLFYIKREDFEGLPFNYFWSDDIAEQVVQEWGPLITAWMLEQVPACTCAEDYGGNGIKYCRYIEKDGESCCDLKLIDRHLADLEERADGRK